MQTRSILPTRVSLLSKNSLQLASGCTDGLDACKVHMSVSYDMCKPSKDTCKTLEVKGSTYNTSKENACVNSKFPLKILMRF